MTRRRLLASAILGLLCLAPAAGAATAIDDAIGQLVTQLEDGAPETIETLAVWHWGDEKLTEAQRRVFRDDLEIALIQSQYFQYFNRERFRQILKEHQLTLSQLLDPGAMKAAGAAGIQGFLSIEVVDCSAAHPEFADQDPHCVLLAKLTDAKTAAIAWAGYIEGTHLEALRALLGTPKRPQTSTRYRQIAQAVAKSLVASGLAEAELKTFTFSSPPKDGEPGTGIGLRNPVNAPLDLQAFQEEILLAIAATEDYHYVDPAHIARLVATWQRDSDSVAQANKQALAGTFALDGYLFGEVRQGDGRSLELSLRLVSLKDGSEAWAGKFAGTDTLTLAEPRPVPEPPMPKEEPAEPEALTLEDIERPLEPPIPQPEPLPLPDAPQPPQLPNPVAALLYLPLGLPRDALDAAFLTVDRVPLLGAATSAVYRYSGLGHLCRLGARKPLRDDLTEHRTLTYGQFASRDAFPTFFPLVASAQARHNCTSDYILQASLGAASVLDLFDAAYTTLDRTPVVGALSTVALLPVDYAWRHVPEDRDVFVPQVTPGRPESRLTFGSMAGEHPWSLFPNARSWPFTFATPAARRHTYGEYARQREAIEKENEERLKQWLAEDEARKKHNEEALETLRKRNIELRRQHELDLAKVRRDNEQAKQKFLRDKKAAEDHNRRAAQTNTIASCIFDLQRAVSPRPPRRAPQPRPKAAPAPKPPVGPPPRPAPKPVPKPAPGPVPRLVPKPAPGPAPKPVPKPAPKPAPEPAPKPAPPPAPAPKPAPAPAPEQ